MCWLRFGSPVSRQVSQQLAITELAGPRCHLLLWEMPGNDGVVFLTCTAIDRTLLTREPFMRSGTLRLQKRRRKQERLEARVSPAQKRLLERAANLRGTSLTDFVLTSAQEAATKTIKDFEILTLCDEAREVFIKALMNPPAPNERLRRAADRYKKYVGI